MCVVKNYQKLDQMLIEHDFKPVKPAAMCQFMTKLEVNTTSIKYHSIV